MLAEIFDTGNFTWKVFSKKPKECLPEPFRSVIGSFMQTQSCWQKHKDCTNSICQRFSFIRFWQWGYGYSQYHICPCSGFYGQISKSRLKKIDDVVYALSAFFRYLYENELYGDNFWVLLAAPRCRNHHVRRCMTPREISRLLESIDR